VSYALIRERLRVLSSAGETDLTQYYARDGLGEASSELGKKYGQALALMRANKPREAARILYELVQQNESQILLYSALGQAEVQGGQANDGISTFLRAMALFPRNVPLTVRYAEALMTAGRAKEAHVVLLDLFNNVPPTPEQIRLTALAASAAGDTGDAYFYMSEYHIASGDLPLAMQQLELALAAPNLNPVQRGRFQARLDEIREYLATVKVRRVRREAEQR
jgi:beta-barrel assembly-enhancing protease